MVYQDRELPKLLYRETPYGYETYLGKEYGWKYEDDTSVWEKLDDVSEYRVLTDEQADKFIEENFE